MANIKSRDRFNVKGGGLLKSAVIASGGALVTMDDLGYLDESGIMIDPGMVQWDDERGFVINSIPGVETWKFTANLMQSSIDEINLVKNGWNWYRHFYYYVKLANGLFQEMYIPLAKIINSLDLKYKAPDKRLVKVEILALMPKGVVTVVPAELSVPADAYGIIIENAAAKGEVTTATGTIYTAAV